MTTCANVMHEKGGSKRCDTNPQPKYKLGSPLPLASKAVRCKPLKGQESILVLWHGFVFGLLEG